MERRAYPSDVSDEEWAFVAPYLTLITTDAPQRVYELREVFSAYVYLLEKVRLALATSYAYANPVVAVALGVGLAGEQITAFGLVAMVVILIGVAMVVLARARG